MVQISSILNYLNKPTVGKEISIEKAVPISRISKNSVAFIHKEVDYIPDVEALILVPNGFDSGRSESKCIFIEVDNPKLSFAKVVQKYFTQKIERKAIHQTVVLGNKCEIDETVSMGVNCVIGNGVKIGANTIIKNNVVISDNVVVGDNCYIKSGAIIGEDGFGFAFEKDGTPVRIPHIGSVIIGNNVEIGSNSVIVRGTLDSTIIESNVKIDDQVFIAHNCNIGKNTVIIAFAEISGSVHIGENCWIGPNSSIIQKVGIGSGVTIGIGAVVTKDVSDNQTIMGIEAMPLRQLAKVRKQLNNGSKG